MEKKMLVLIEKQLGLGHIMTLYNSSTNTTVRDFVMINGECTVGIGA